MAYVLSQLPIHCSPVKLLKEPDVIPTFEYLMERELGTTKPEDPRTTSDNNMQLNDDVAEVTDDVKCEDITDVYTGGTLDGDYTEEDVPDPGSCKDMTDLSNDGAPNSVMTTPVSCEDSTEPVLLPNATSASLKRKLEMKEFTIPLKKLRVATNCLNKKLELEEDEYIFCSKCDKLQIGACSIHCSLRWVKQPSAVLVTEGITKARATIPGNMELKSSSIPDAGLGIFAKEKFESDVVFGPYWGQKIGVADVTPNMDQGYMWDIIEHGRVTHVVDARDESHSNWLRFVNCARSEDEQNLVAFQYRGEIYYRSYKVIEPGMELLVWYGDRYACDLDILDKDKKLADGPIQCQKCFMICWGPNSLASHNKFRCQMNSEHDVWRCMHCDRSFKTQSSLHFHKNIHKGLKPFPCKICGKVFAYPASRRRHYDQHFRRKSVSCTKCRKVFVDKNSLHSHLRNHCKGQDEYKCQHCGQCFKSGVGLSNHLRTHEKTNALNFCSICKLSYTYSFTFARHMKRRHPQVKILRCGKCGKACADKSRLALHIAIKHSRKQGNESHRGFSSDSHLKQRSRQHVKGNKHLQQSKKGVSVAEFIRCKKCKRSLPRNKVLNHICIHQNTDMNKVAGQGTVSKKPVNSSGQQRGNYPSLPKNSLASHNGTVRCEFCFKGFPSWELMYRHRAAHFRKINPALPAIVNTEQGVASKKPANSLRQKRENFLNLPKDRSVSPKSAVKCEFCFKAFPNLDLMQCHRAAHFRKTNPALPIPASIQPTGSPRERLDNSEHDSKSKKIRCNICSKTFPSLQKLNCHRAIHSSDIGKCCCNICGRSFQTKTSLASHKSHHSLNRRAPISLHRHSQETTEPHAAEKKCPSINMHCHKAANFRKGIGRFCCNVCGKSFQTKMSLGAHKTHHSLKRRARESSDSHRTVHFRKGIGRFCCNVCGKSFQTKMSLGAHKTHHSLKRRARESSDSHRTVHFRKGIGRFCCKACGKSFPTERSLRSHKTHHGRAHGSTNTLLNPSPKRYQETAEPKAVDKGSKSDVSSTEIEENKSLHSNEDHSVGRNTCKKHLLTSHSSSTSSSENAFSTSECKLLECDVCGKKFRVKAALQRHRGQHTRGKQFRTHHLPKANFKSRAVVGGNVPKPFECSNCLESFSTRPAVAVHKGLVHHGINSTIVCPFCDKTFSSKEVLLVHKQALHSTADPFLCLNCNAQFTSKYSRNNHSCRVEKKKTSVKPDEASVESNPTVDKSYQESHVCNTCFESFPSIRSLSCHKRSHAGISTPYACSICRKGFSTKFSVLRHKRNQHGATSLLCKNESTLKGNRSDHSSISQIATCDKTAREGSEAILTASDCLKQLALQHRSKESAQKNSSPPKTQQSTRDAASISQFCCLPCNKRFLSYGGLYKHKRKHHSERKFDCAQTEQTSVDINLDRDCKPNSKDDAISQFVCLPCDKQFLSRSDLNGHELQHHAKSKAGVAQSEQTKVSVSLDSQQGVKQDGQDYVSCRKCYYCEKVFQSDGGLRKHIRKIHRKRKSLKDSFECPYCEKEFMTLSGRKKHVWRKHPKCKRKKVDDQQACRPEMKANIEASSSETTNATRTCHHCKMSILTSGSQRSRQSCSRCNTELSTPSGSNRDSSSSMVSSKPTVRAFRCQYCLKGFSTLHSRYKHIMLVHGTDLICIPPTPCKTSESSHNNTINPDSLTGKKAESSEAVQNCHMVHGSASDDNHQLRETKSKAVSDSLKCPYCEKEFMTLSGRKKHVWRKHPKCKRKKVDDQQACRPEMPKANIEASSSETTNTTLTCHHCKMSILTSGSESSHLSCSRCNTELSMPSGINRDSSSSMVSSKPTMRAFRCQYCLKGFSTLHSRYKHIMLVHGTDLICIPPTPCKTSESSHNNTINPDSLTEQQESSEAVQNCHMVHGSASDDNHQLREAKSKTVRKLIRGRPNHSALGCHFYCWYCGRNFFTRSSRRIHQLKVHERRMGSSSVLLKCENGNIDKGKRSGNTARQVPFASPSTDVSRARKVSGSTLQPTDKAFPCQYCPRQFVSVSGRYKHVALAHSGKTSTSSKARQSYKVPIESSEPSVSPAKKARLSSNSPGQPQEMAPVVAKTVESDATSGCHGAVSSSSKQTMSRIKAFQCAYCTKSFSACSLRYKHYLLVHSRSRDLAEHGFVALEMGSTNNPSQTLLLHTTSNDSVSIVKPIKSNFVSQHSDNFSLPDNCSKVVSVFEEKLEPYTCRICSKFFRTKDDWVTHFKQEHNKAGKAMCEIRGPPRPALRTISAAFHNNSLRPLRNRRVTRSKVKNEKQESSLCGRNVAKAKCSVRLSTKQNIRDKRFQCDVCLLFFSTKDCVSRHKKTKHCNDRPFQCNDCGFATKRGDYIPIHKRYYCKGSI